MREIKGRDIANKCKIVRSGNLWLVPSQSGAGKYKVDADASNCTCPDFEIRRAKCKHIFAVELTIQRERKIVTETKADGTTKTTVTETVRVKRQTYRQDWPAYNKAQTFEKSVFLHLLNKLCEGVGSPAQYGAGQRRLPLEDMIFAMAYKVYSTVSGRRFMTDLRDAHSKGYISQLPSYNSIFNYFESDMLTPYLQMLIEESSLPLRAVESDFAIDSSGLSTGAHQRWVDVKWGAVHAEYGDMRRDWVKLHIMCGVKTNVVTAVEVTDSHTGDSPMFAPLVEATAANFSMKQVSADKAYISDDNLRAVARQAATPYIPFKITNIGHGKNQSSLWKKMYHYFAFNQDRFMQHYHKRSNVETTFAMIKAKFGGKLRSKTQRAQINEALCKVLCHNICCLIQSMYELKIRPKFYAEVA